MDISDDSIIYTDDFTRVITYQSHQWTLGDLSLAAINGVQWNAVPGAVGFGMAVAVPPAGLLWLCGLSPVWAVLIPPIPMVLSYLRRAKDRQGGLSEREKRLLRSLFRRQPAELLGLAQNTEPTSFRWDVTFYLPPNSPPRRAASLTRWRRKNVAA